MGCTQGKQKIITKNTNNFKNGNKQNSTKINKYNDANNNQDMNSNMQDVQFSNMKNDQKEKDQHPSDLNAKDEDNQTSKSQFENDKRQKENNEVAIIAHSQIQVQYKIDNQDEKEKSVTSNLEQFQNVLEQEGFNEKVNHIHKMFDILLQSNDDNCDYHSIADPELNNFFMEIQGISQNNIEISGNKDIPQIQRDQNGETIIEIPTERMQNNFKGITNAVLSLDYKLITSSQLNCYESKQLQNQEKVFNRAFSHKQVSSIATLDGYFNSPSTLDNTDNIKSYSNFKQNDSPSQKNQIPSLKINFTENQSSQQQNQLSLNLNQIQTPNKNGTFQSQQLKLYTINEEAKGADGQEDHYDYEEELQTNKQQIQQSQYQNHIKIEESVYLKTNQKQSNQRQTSENSNTVQKKYQKKNLVIGEGLSSSNRTGIANSYAFIEKSQKQSHIDFKMPQTPNTIKNLWKSPYSQNEQISEYQYQGVKSSYRQSTNFNEISFTEIEQDFQENNPFKPQSYVSSLVIFSQHQLK